MTLEQTAIIIAFAGLLLTLIAAVWKSGKASGIVGNKLDEVVHAIEQLHAGMKALGDRQNEHMSETIKTTHELRSSVSLCHQRLDAFEELCDERRGAFGCERSGERRVAAP